MDLISSRHTSPKPSPQSTKEPITTWNTEHKHLPGFNRLTICSTLSRSSKLNAIPLKRKNGQLTTQPPYTFRLGVKQTVIQAIKDLLELSLAFSSDKLHSYECLPLECEIIRDSVSWVHLQLCKRI